MISFIGRLLLFSVQAHRDVLIAAVTQHGFALVLAIEDYHRASRNHPIRLWIEVCLQVVLATVTPHGVVEVCLRVVLAAVNPQGVCVEVCLGALWCEPQSCHTTMAAPRPYFSSVGTSSSSAAPRPRSRSPARSVSTARPPEHQTIGFAMATDRMIARDAAREDAAREDWANVEDRHTYRCWQRVTCILNSSGELEVVQRHDDLMTLDPVQDAEEPKEEPQEAKAQEVEARAEEAEEEPQDAEAQEVEAEEAEEGEHAEQTDIVSEPWPEDVD